MQLEKMTDFFNTRADTYDAHMLDDCGLDEFYETIAACFNKPLNRLLDLGCGTGLELARLFNINPNMEVTGIDMSSAMLEQLRKKFPDQSLELICGSYFDVVFGNGFDAALSTYSFHHFSEKEKHALYTKIHASIKPGGFFVFGDFTVQTQAQQDELLDENRKLRAENGIPNGEFYHFDTPFTAENEMRILASAGFKSIHIVREWERASIIVAER